MNGQFQILQKIGSGGMGAVYKAAQPDMNRHVAVKILHQKLTARKDLTARFRREARAMSSLTHPNTVKVLLYGELDDGALYIVMEYLEGRNLNQVVRKEGPLPPERALPVLIQVCGALQEAHLQGIIHRDLKPENIFLSNNGGLRDYPKVLDFGLAKVTERQLRPGSVMLTQEGMVFGTPEFMSPEQAQGKPLDARSDIYSLAVILYEVLTGKLPFDAKTPMEYIQCHVTKQPIGLSDRVASKRFVPGLDAVLARALSKKPEDRYATAADFAQALKPYAGMGGKGFTAMMPRASHEAAAHSYEIRAAVEVPGAAAPLVEVPDKDLPVIPIDASKQSVPIRSTGSIPVHVSGAPSLVKDAPAPLIINAPAANEITPPPSTRRPSSVRAPIKKKRATPTPMMLVGVAIGSLLAGVGVTLIVIRLVFGGG